MVVACRVGATGEAGEVDEGGAADVVGDGLEGELEGVAEEPEDMRLLEVNEYGGRELVRRNVRKVTGGLLVLDLLFSQEPGERHNVGVNLLRLALGAVAGVC